MRLSPGSLRGAIQCFLTEVVIIVSVHLPEVFLPGAFFNRLQKTVCEIRASLIDLHDRVLAEPVHRTIYLDFRIHRCFDVHSVVYGIVSHIVARCFEIQYATMELYFRQQPVGRKQLLIGIRSVFPAQKEPFAGSPGRTGQRGTNIVETVPIPHSGMHHILTRQMVADRGKILPARRGRAYLMRLPIRREIIRTVLKIFLLNDGMTGKAVNGVVLRLR